jgi:hypothetical protein
MTDTAHAPKITAFGDESIATGKVVTYAAAVFETDRIGEAEAVVAAIKHEFGLAPDEHLHCRVIFSGDARAKTPWGALSREKINQLIEDLCLKMKGLQLRPLVAALDPRNVPAMPPAPGLPDRELHEKQIASLGFAAIDVQLRNKYGLSDVQFCIDPDTTKIPWGAGKAQVNTTRDGLFYDLGAGIEPPYLKSSIATDPKPRLLEIADLYAYVAKRALEPAGGWESKWFQELYRTIDPEQCEFSFNAGNHQWHAKG